MQNPQPTETAKTCKKQIKALFLGLLLLLTGHSQKAQILAYTGSFCSTPVQAGNGKSQRLYSPGNTVPAIAGNKVSVVATDRYPRPILENNGIVYTGTKNGLFIAADANTGKILREHKAGNSSINKITADKEGNIWISLIEGSLFQYKKL